MKPRQSRARDRNVLKRRFALPHIAHAPMEPVNATVRVGNGVAEVFGSIQSVDACQKAVGAALGIPPDDVSDR